MTFIGIISKFASRVYKEQTYWDLIVADSSPDPRTRFLSEVELSRFDAADLQKRGFKEGSAVQLRIRKVTALRNGNPVVEGILEEAKSAAK